jgi:hypothetical protein
MNNLVGYIIQGQSTLKDICADWVYAYQLAGNGVFIQTAGKHISAVISIAECDIRGLPKLKNDFILHHGRIPQRFWDLALSVMLASPEEERYVGIRWNGAAYDLYYPEQWAPEKATKATGVSYRCGEDIVVELHSHPGMGSAFSSTDDADEQGLKIYGVLGWELKDYSALNGGLPVTQYEPLINLRVGVYGYWAPVSWGEIFEGTLQGVADVVDLERKEEVNE